MEAITIGELRKRFPFPWTHQEYAKGLIKVLDAEGKEVPIPHMVTFLATITTVISKQPIHD